MTDYEFGMFSDAGEDLMHDIVKLAGKHALSDSSILAILNAVSEHDEAFHEAADTVVRERVFKYLHSASW